MKRADHYKRLSRLLFAASEIGITTNCCSPTIMADVPLAHDLLAKLHNNASHPTLSEDAAKRTAELCLLAFLKATDDGRDHHMNEDLHCVRHIARVVLQDLRLGYKLAEGEVETQPRG